MNQERFEEWAIVELFGHNRTAGRITEQTIGGETFIRVDVPETTGQPAFSKLYGKGAIYAITITDEITAKAAAHSWAPRPLDRFELGQLVERQKLLEAGASEQKCRVCGCDELHACQTDEGPCHWVEDDLCSGCAGDDDVAF